MSRVDDRHHGVKRHRVDAGAVENSPRVQKKKRHDPSQEESKSLLAEAYPLIWDTLLDSSNPTKPGVIDFESIASFMLVSRASKEAFDAVRGWWQCAQALKREANAKRSLIRPFEEHCSEIEQRMVQMPGDASQWRHEILFLYKEVNISMGAMERRLFHIHYVLLPLFASRLAVVYGCEEVSADPYVPGRGSMTLQVAYLLRKAEFKQEIEEWIAAGRIAI